MASSLFSTSNPTDQVDYYGVRLGVWTNWSRGPVFGATLTLTRDQGSLLISFTAFFVTIVASRFWMVACLVLHRYFSAAVPHDALHHQRQAIFRNSTSSGSGLWSLIQLLYAWRNLAQRYLIRVLPSIIFASLCLVLFAFASGFSSSISTAIGDEVLIDATNCGWPALDQSSVNNSTQIIEPWFSGLINNAANYAQQVYSPSGTGIFDNSIFVKRRLGSTSNPNAPCPFRDDLCRSNSSNLILDSGYQDARNDFGINLPKEQSFQVRQILHCAPLVTEGHEEQIQLNQTNYTQYHYGPLNLGDPSLNFSNYTFIVEDIRTQYIKKSSQNLFDGYGLSVIISITVDGTPLQAFGEFNPQKGLRRPDADVFLIFLSGNGVQTPSPSNDSWYRSNVPSVHQITQGARDGAASAYRPEEAGSPLGCASQVQVCKGPTGGNNSCTTLGSMTDAWTGAGALFGLKETNLSKYQSFDPLIAEYADNEDASRYLWLAGIYNNYPNAVTQPILKLGYQSLDSYKNYFSGVQAELADDQWKLDVTSWWNISMALQQASFVDSAFGPTYPGIYQLKQNATNTGQKSICQNQKILSTRYTSVSLFGLYFTYIVGILIIFISFILEPILSYVQKRWKYREYENLEWVSNGTLNLQRLVYDESGQGTWSNCNESIPVTEKGELLPPLDITDLEHPRLNRSAVPAVPVKDVSGSTLLQSSPRLYSQFTTATPSLAESDQEQELHVTSASSLPIMHGDSEETSARRQGNGNSVTRLRTLAQYSELQSPGIARYPTVATLGLAASRSQPVSMFSATGQGRRNEPIPSINADTLGQHQ
ncbi:hypothetical protein GGR55DRAFT_545264 [Xylaria sp. FL0064]|nr:hypothetical protein GGR55DRAFT_545264 [Xylaria sp. FL0064]